MNPELRKNIPAFGWGDLRKITEVSDKIISLSLSGLRFETGTIGRPFLRPENSHSTNALLRRKVL
jgi:hypothetical protein